MNDVSQQPMLEVRGVSKTFGSLVAVSNVDLDMQPGQIRGLIGPNGSGKSTTFNLLSGFLSPSSGTVRFRGKEITGAAPHTIAAAGLVRTFQLTSLYHGQTVAENIWMGRHLTRINKRTANSNSHWTVDSVLEYFDLEGYRNTSVDLLPDGTQRVVSLAVAVAAEPTLLLLDEPLAGLNPTEKGNVAKKILNLKTRGMSVLLVEHDVKSVMSLCDRISVINFGEIIAEGLPSEIVANEAVIEAYLGQTGGADA